METNSPKKRLPKSGEAWRQWKLCSGIESWQEILARFKNGGKKYQIGRGTGQIPCRSTNLKVMNYNPGTGKYCNRRYKILC